MLDDGSYEAVVVDAATMVDGTLSIDLTIVAGPAKGQVVTVVGPLAADPLDLLALPATVTVADGSPSLRLER